MTCRWRRGWPKAPNVVEFTSERGGLLMMSASGAATAAAVRSFYETALPPLGWAQSPGEGGELVFQRGRERLSLRISQESERVRLNVELLERPASMSAD